MKRFILLIVVSLALMPLLKSSAFGRPVSTIGPVVGRDHGLHVDLWTNRAQDEIYDIGDHLEIAFRANDDCYVTIYTIDTDGNVDVLFPQYPDDGFIFGGLTYQLPDYYDAMDLRLRGPRGVGYLHAVASRRPGAFRLPVYSGRYRLMVDPVAGDPFIAINRINTRLIPPGHIHASVTVSFFVGSRVWYPRYMCYDCHGRAIRFDPYHDACASYSVRVARGYDYWWGYDYHPGMVRYAFTGPFWRFELRTLPAYRHRSIRYIDCAVGSGNYYPIRPITRPVRQVVYRPTARRAIPASSGSPVKYRDTRLRRNGTALPGSTSTGGSRSDVSGGSTRSTTTSRSRSTAVTPTTGTPTTTSR
ncbi:MAG: DUF4384 domain-containing protein, partial [Bacteroidetes bacterium]|nr:DUF4384 domain-containing protein [Bacteroidota bacterium]